MALRYVPITTMQRLCCDSVAILERIEYVLDGHIHILSKLYDVKLLSLSMMGPSGFVVIIVTVPVFFTTFFYFFAREQEKTK